MPTKIADRYLGDGVYASYDGFGVMLDLRGQDTTTRIALEPKVLVELNRFWANVVASDGDVVRRRTGKGRVNDGKRK